ncbi:hypothetical protein BOX15_Mlig034201g1, partial [Macrostomum lignano]
CSKMKIIITILLLASVIYRSDAIATMAIDLGSEFMKIAIVKPGVPMEIALNRESQRKTPVVVGMRNDERQIGDPALSMAVKFPQNAFIFIPTLIGQSLNSPAVKLFQERFPYYKLSEDNEGVLTFTTVNNKKLTVEEILAMLLENAQETAQKFADQPIKDAVITVPPYFSQAERLAVLRAADYAGITVLQLMNSNAAVALNFGIFRSKSFNKTAQYYMFYDMGSSSTIATVVSYQVARIREHGMAEEHPQLQVLGVGYDETLGASAFILRLRDHLAKEFNAKKLSKKDITGNARAMAKLFKEAGRVYRVLSANKEVYAQIESVFEDKDFKVKVTREELENICSDLFERVTRPIESALNMAQISMDLIKEVLLMGGGTRNPKVQSALLKATGRTELGKSINTDEAAALGAVYQAAHLSPGFRVKRFVVKDAVLFPLAVDFKTAEDGKEIKRLLFNLGNHYPQRKVMTFNKHTQDFDFSVGYTSLNHLNEFQQKALGDPLLYKFSLKGVAQAIGKYDGQPGASSKGVKAHFRMDDNGIVHLDRAEAQFEILPQAAGSDGEAKKEEGSAFAKIGESLGSLFGSSEADKKADEASGAEKQQAKSKEDSSSKPADKDSTKTNAEPGEKTGDSTAAGNASKASGDKAAQSNNNTNKSESAATPAKPELRRESIEFVVADKTLVHPSDASQQKSRSTIQELRKREEAKRQLEKARNELEAFIFESKDRLSSADYEKCSTESERQGYMEKLSAAQDWYDEQGMDTTQEQFAAKTAELKAMLGDLTLRVREMLERPKAFKLLKDMLNHTRTFWDTMQNMTGDGNVFTQAEYNTLGNLINDTEDWQKARQLEVDGQDLTKEPLVRVEDIRLKMSALEREISYLLGKIKYYVPPTPKPTEQPKQDSDPKKTDADSTSSSSEQQKPPGSAEEQKPQDEGATPPPTIPPPPPPPPQQQPSADEVESGDIDSNSGSSRDESSSQSRGRDDERDHRDDGEDRRSSRGSHDPDDEL